MPTATSSVPPRFQLSRLISSVWIPQAIHATAVLQLADRMASGPQHAEAIARAAGTHPHATYRLLRALAVLEIVAQDSEGRFELTPLGACLRSDAPDSVRAWAQLWGGPMMWRPWGHLADCVRTGEMAPKLLDGFETPFQMMEQYPEEHAIFNRSMLELTRGIAPVLPRSYDFGRARCVVDVGGGCGQLLPPLLRAYPALRAIVYDVAACAEGARKLAEEEKLAERMQFVAGDFFAAVPPDGDVYVIKSVIHDWDDERSRAILARCRDAMRAQARLLVLEWIVPERVGSADASIVGTDLNMLVMVGGLERTESEYRALLRSAGLEVAQVIPTPAGMSVIEATRG